MRLEIDAGNTYIKWRWVIEGDISPSLRCIKESFLGRVVDIDVPESNGEVLKEIWIGSVAGAAFNKSLVDALAQRWDVLPVFAVSSDYASQVKNSYDHPQRMGVDRWLAMLAARHQDYGPSIIVDCGSAITIDYMNAEGCHQGGYILPGLQMMRATLLQKTAHVRFEDEDLHSIEPGKNTGDCVNNGTRFLLQALAEKMQRESNESGAQLYITGGDGYLLQAEIPGALLVPDLVLDGLIWADKQ